MVTIPKYAIIVAAGSGKRMKSHMPKQFLELSGLPVFMHTVQKFYNYDADMNIILVINKEEEQRLHYLYAQHNFNIPVTIAYGGASRFQSVRNGLDKVSYNAVVAVHDAVRPLVSTDVIHSGFAEAYTKGNAVASLPVYESIRELGPEGVSKAVDRNNYRLMQTPQTFKSGLIKNAFQQVEEQAQFTDEATVLERAGGTINLIEGNPENIKITSPPDLILAKAYMQEQV